MGQRTRDGAHYATNRMFQGPREAPSFMGKDAAYRRALGLSDGEPIPKALGLVGRNHAPDDAAGILM